MRIILTLAASLLATATWAANTPLTSEEPSKEQTVVNWVLCTSEANAVALVDAREQGVEQALHIYSDLAVEKKCGQFPLLKIRGKISLKVGTTATAYQADVQLGDKWPTGYVVSDAF